MVYSAPKSDTVTIRVDQGPRGSGRSRVTVGHYVGGAGGPGDP